MDMKTERGYLRLRILWITVCAVLCCVLFALGFALPKRVLAADTEEPTPAGKTYTLTVALSQKEGYVFTRELTEEQKYNLVEVTATYTEDLEEGSSATPETVTETLALSGSGNSRTAATGETVTFSFASDKITAAVTPREKYPSADGAAPAEGTLNVTYGTKRINGISATYTGATPVTLSSDIRPGNFTVRWAYNDGTVDNSEQGIVVSASYELVNLNLFPDKFPTKDEEKTYSKNVEIMLTENAAAQYGCERFSTKAVIENIQFDDPSEIRSVNGNSLPKQFARDELKLGNELTVTLVFGTGLNRKTYDVPLSVFEDSEGAITPTYYTTEGVETTVLSTNVNRCEIAFHYPGTSLTATSSILAVEVEEILISAPTFPADKVIGFYPGVGIGVSGLDFSSQFTPSPNISVTVTKNASDAKVTRNGDTATIEFEQPGIDYDVCVKLLPDEKGNLDFQWTTPSSSAAVLKDKYTIVYNVQVEKGTWDLTLSDTNSFKWTYGGTAPGGSVVGDLQGTDENEKQEFTSGSSEYGFDLQWLADGAWTSNAPKNAGKYQVKAVSRETDRYKSSESNVCDVTVSPKQIAAQDAVKTVTYDGTTYSGKSILNGYITGTVGSDDLAIDVKSEGGGTFSAKYYNTADAKGYKVVLTLGNTNYVFKELPAEWSGVGDLSAERTDDSAYFLIQKREIKYSVSQEDFYYGKGSSSAFSATLNDSANSGKFVTETPTVSYAGAGKTYSDRTKINEWDASDTDYTVTYTPVHKNSADTQERASLILTAVTAKFKVKKAQIKNITIDDDATKFYTGSAQTFTFTGWDSGIIAGDKGKHNDLSTIFTRSVTGARLGAVDLSSFGAAIKLTEADEYTVTVSILDTTNFEWSDGGEDKTVTWTINKNRIWKADAPDTTLTYNHAAQELTLVREGSGGQWSSDLMEILSVTGTTVSGKTISSGFGFEDGTVSLTYAGTYTITVGLKDENNYAWYDSAVPDGVYSSDSIIIEFTLDRATAALLSNSAETDFNDAEKPSFEIPKAKKAAAVGGELTELSFVFTVKNEAGTQVATNADIDGKKVDASGVYTYTITGFTGGEADNYVMPAGGLTFTFNVKSQNLAIPTFGADNKLTYNGAEQSILHFINGYSESVYGDRIVITIKKGNATVALGADPKVKDVYLVGEKVTAYQVTVTPAPNYQWDTPNADDARKEYGFTFTVEQFGLTVTWTASTLSSVYGGTVAPAYKLDKFDPDAVTVGIGYKKGADTLASAPAAAGNYFVYATGLSGAAKDNYYLKTNPDTVYTIKKQTIIKPMQTAVYTSVFGEGTESGGQYSNQNSFDYQLLSASVTGYRPESWFVTGGNRALTLGAETRFDLETGKFFYLNAGYYTLTFTINDGNNYCWSGDNDTDFDTTSYTHPWNDFAKIERKTLNTPAFGSTEVTVDGNKKTVHNRAQEWGMFDGTKLAVVSPLDGVAVTVLYGERKKIDGSYQYQTATEGVKGSQSQSAVGQYYIYVKVTAAEGIDILNYVWGDSADGTVEFVDGADVKIYGESEVSIKLHYAITSTQLVLKFENVVYTFGENGIVAGVDTKYTDLFSALTLKDDGSEDRLTADGTNMTWSRDHITFVKATFKKGDTELTAAELENGLPWNAGSYKLSFEIKFSNSNYQNLTVSDLPVTVNKRALELDWTNLSKTYNGTSELGTASVATATMKNVPARASGNITLPTLTVAAREGEAKNFGNYTLYISGLSGENKDNFTYTGAKNSYMTEAGAVPDSAADVPFSITKYSFTATANNNISYTYGDAVPNDQWTAGGDNASERPSTFADDIKGIVLQVKSGTTVVQKPVCGTDYTIVPAWSQDNANYDVTWEAANFTVGVRNISVALKAGDKQTLNGNTLSSVYYADATNYTIANYAYDVTYNGAEANAIVAGDHPFELRSAVTRGSDVTAEGYPITIKVTDGNYQIVILTKTYSVSDSAAETGYVHKIVNAALAPSVTPNAGGTYTANPYAYLAANPSVTGSTNADLSASANNAQWWIFKAAEGDSEPAADAAGWELYNASEKHFGTDAGKYYFFVKVTATNHDSEIVSAAGNKPFSFEIKNATLKNVNFVASSSPVYNAQPYPYLSERRTVQGVNLDQNNLAWYIFAATEGDSKPAADVAGWKPYNAAEYSRTDAGKVYFFVKIEADNHDALVIDEGGKPLCLDIQKATLTLFADMSIFFNEENPATAGYYMDGGAVTVEKLKAGYVDGIFLIDEEHSLLGTDALATLAGLSGSFTYSVNYTKSKSGVGDDYAIVLNVNGLSSDNYKFSAKNGTLEVKALPVSATISAESTLTAVYGTTGLLMPVAVVKSEQVSTYDGTTPIDISNLDYADIVTVNTEALVADGDAYTTNDVKAGGYDVTLTFGANFALTEGGYTTVQYTVTTADNRITTENYSLFKNADSWKTGDSAKNAAWVYGKFADDGYKAEGSHSLNGFELLSRANSLKITLAFGGDSKEVVVAADGNILSALNNLFSDWAVFNAGSYTVTYHMDASNNYNAFNEVWNFTVAKRAVTVTPNAVEVVYGENVDAGYLLAENSYKYTNTALDGYGEAREEINAIVGTFNFGTVKEGAAAVYAAGWNFGTYEIKVLIGGTLAGYDGDTYEHETDNYVFTFGKSDFGVTKREVTVTIGNASNHYMLVGDYNETDSEYAIEEWATLGYTFAEDSKKFFRDEEPFTLQTAALVDSLTTKSVGEYAIYAQFVSETAKSNYNIVIANGAYSSEVDTGVLSDAVEELIVKKDGRLYGGVFEVQKAVLTARREGPFYKDPNGTAEFGGERYTRYTTSDATTYDGREKYYFATTNVRSDLKDLIPSFTPVYKKNGAVLDGAPKNVGQYGIEFKPDGENVNFEPLKITNSSFDIYARGLTVSAQLSGGLVEDGNKGTYNGKAYTVAFTFATPVGEEVLRLDVKVNGETAGDLIEMPKEGDTRNILRLSATEAGEYTVTARLSGDGMDNYSLSGGVYTYKLIIQKAGLNVVVQNAEIEYGTPLTPNSLFTVAYSLTSTTATETDQALLDLIQANIASGDFVAPAGFVYDVGVEGNRYSDGSGGVQASPADKSQFRIYITNLNDTTVSNYEVNVVAGTLKVIQRVIRVNLYGVADNEDRGTDIAHNVYDANDHSAAQGGSGAFKADFEKNKTDYLALVNGFTFGNSGMTIANLGVELTIPDNSRDAGRYPIYAADTDPNFEISFCYDGSPLTENSRPRYQIDQKTLIAKVQGAGTAYEAALSTVNVVYGNEALQSLFTVCYDGWVHDQGIDPDVTKIAFVIGDETDRTDAAKTYVAYGSQVGQTYEVRISGLQAGTDANYRNYNIILKTATLAITPRPIGASIGGTREDRTFKPDPANDYHGGAWGMPIEAIIAFTGVDSQNRLKDGYTLSYNTEADALGQTRGTAPVKVGDYTVTVHLTPNSVGNGNTYYNYTFSETNPAARSHTLDYSIIQRDVNLTFDNPTVYEQGEVYITGEFCAAVMNVVSVTLGEKSVEYTATNEAFFITVGDENGVYTVTIELKESAKSNYRLTGNVAGVMEPVERRVISFTYSSDTNRQTKIVFDTSTLSGWIYSESAMDPRAQVLLNNGTPVSGALVIFDYAPVTNAPDGTNLNTVHDSLSGWVYDNTQWKTVVSDTGKYILRARYMGQTSPDVYHASSPKYFYFEIAKKELDKPEVKDKDSYFYAEKDGVGYIEGEVEGFVPSAMQIVSADVQASYVNGALKLFATGKGDFAVTIALTDSNNYVWKDDKTVDDVKRVWSIKPAEDNELSWADTLSTVKYAENYTLVANPQNYRYNLRLTYAYTLRDEKEEKPAESAVWTNGFPVNAGKYWVRATGMSPEGNYNTATTDLRAFKITKVALTLDPRGSMTYGETFAQNMNDYSVVADGLVNGDTEQMIRRDLKNIVYTVTNAPKSGLWQAGSGYRLTVSAEATNYEIGSRTGTFTVNKARLYVTIGNNAQSLYKQALNLSAATLTLRDVVSGDKEADLRKELIGKLKFVNEGVTENSDAGRYELTLSVGEIANYTLSVTNGVYTINKLPVRVEADWGGYDYGTTPKLPSVKNVFDGTTKLTLTAAELAEFGFVYAGSPIAPTEAGEHVVSVHIAEDSNYTLASPVSGLFVIRQTVLDADLIVWEVVYFDTVIKKPEVDHIENGAFTEDMFTIRYLGDWDHAGVAYTIELTLTRPDSTKWRSVEGEIRTLTYTVSRGFNELVSGIEIEGWVYGDYNESNLPTADSKFGTVVFEYSDEIDGSYTTAAPVNGDADTYWVRAVVEGSSDYERYVSPAVSFEITPKAISAPKIEIISEGWGQNNVYTGVAMQADVTGYDSKLMYIRYDDGAMIVDRDLIKIIATNAGSYRVTVELANEQNYVWAEGTSQDGDGNALLTWTIARKKLARPTHNDATLIVNGRELAYYPIGFDASVMSISDNTSGYGGTFKATVSLIDTDNYEWADGSTDDVFFEWYVVGADSVFAVVISILSVLAAAAAVTGGVEGFLYYKKKKEEQKKAQQSAETKEGV